MQQHLGDAGIIALADLNADIGIVRLEFLQHRYQYMAGHAGKGTDADMAYFKAVQSGGLLGHSLRRVTQVANIGEHLLAVGSQCHPGLAAVEQRHLKFVLQRTDNLAYGGLGIVAVHGGLGHTAKLGNLQENGVFGCHRKPFFLHELLLR